MIHQASNSSIVAKLDAAVHSGAAGGEGATVSEAAEAS